MVYVVMASRALLALVFLVSAGSKLRNRAAFNDFLTSLRKLRLVPGNRARPAATAIVTAEAAVPVALALPPTVTAGFVLAGAALTVFIVVIGASMRSGTAAPCPCFGSSNTPLGGRHIVRNALLLAVALAGGIGTTADLGPAHPAGTVACLAAATVLALVLIRLDELIELFAGPPIAARPTPPGAGR